MPEIEDIHIGIRERIVELLEEKNLSVNKLEKEINVDQKTLHNQINSTTKISLITVYELLKYFPFINPKWLFYGEPFKKHLSKEYTLFSEDSPATAEEDIFHLLRSYEKHTGISENHFHELGKEFGLADNQKIVIPVNNRYEPFFPKASYILIELVPQWKKFLEYGNIYFIELKDNRSLFSIIDGASTSKSFTLKDINSRTSPCELPTNMIRNIWCTKRVTFDL